MLRSHHDTNGEEEGNRGMTKKETKESAKAKKLIDADEATLKDHWESFKQPIAAVKPGTDRSPVASTDLLAPRMFQLCDEVLDPEIDAIAAHFNSKESTEIRQAHGLLVPLVQALRHVTNKAYIYWPQLMENAKKQVQQDIVEAQKLDGVADFWLDILCKVGGISEDVVRRIRDGRGYLDTAADIAEAGEILGKNLDILGPLQEKNEKELNRKGLLLTRETTERMMRLGTDLPRTIARSRGELPKGEVDWRYQVIRVYALLDGAYALVRSATVYHLCTTGRADVVHRR